MFWDRLNDVKVYFLVVVLIGSVVGCDDDNNQPATLRSDMNEYFYTLNNIRATTRLTSIMYNMADSANPVERFKMVHISDTHLSDHSSDNHYINPVNLIESVKFTNQSELRINAMVATGDHINDDKKSKALEYMKSFFNHLYTNNRIPTFPCYGNHDANMYENDRKDYLTPSELSQVFDNKGNYPLQREAGKSYFYADVPNPMGGIIRFISLHMLDQPGNQHDTLHDVVYSKEQISWLGNVALKKDMTDGHSVIILNHYPFQQPWGGFLMGEKFLHSWRMVPEIIEAFRAKQSIREIYDPYWSKENGDESFLPIDVDFDFTSSPGEFICYMGGHSHVTAQFEIKGLRNQSDDLQPQKMLLCTNMSPSEMGVNYNTVERKSNSLSNNSFCIYTIDTQEKNIYITFFGAYLPALLTMETYPDVQVLSYCAYRPMQ